VLVAKLLDMPTGHAEEAEENTAIMHYGYNDLSGQLRSALDRFTGVRLVPFSLVAGLIVLYILLIGPGDYFFLRKVVRRMEWTWLTFPLIVVLVSAGAYFLAYYLKGDQLRVNQVDLVDVDAASGRLRGTTWMNIFSPRMESFNLSVAPRLPAGGLSGTGPFFGGKTPFADQRLSENMDLSPSVRYSPTIFISARATSSSDWAAAWGLRETIITRPAIINTPALIRLMPRGLRDTSSRAKELFSANSNRRQPAGLWLPPADISDTLRSAAKLSTYSCTPNCGRTMLSPAHRASVSSRSTTSARTGRSLSTEML